MAHLYEGGVQDVGGRAGSLGGGRPTKAAAGAGGLAAGDGHAAAGVRLAEELLGRAPELHHLHAQRLAHGGVGLPLQVLERTAARVQTSLNPDPVWCHRCKFAARASLQYRPHHPSLSHRSRWSA